MLSCRCNNRLSHPTLWVKAVGDRHANTAIHASTDAVSGVRSMLNQRRWLLSSPQSSLTPVLTESGQQFTVIRDDLLRPLVEGNKSRKLDGLMPELRDAGVTDIVSGGGKEGVSFVHMCQFSCQPPQWQSGLVSRSGGDHHTFLPDEVGNACL